jgi:hypothetical protein
VLYYLTEIAFLTLQSLYNRQTCVRGKRYVMIPPV